MEQVQQFADGALALVREGFYDINGPKGLLIALAATIFMGSWKQWPAAGVAAVLVHVAIDTLAPVLAGEGEFRLPPLVEPSFWSHVGVLFAGYLIVIAVFYLLKRLLIRGGAAKPAKAH